MSGDSKRQIKQMINFIMQEAHEKVNEIRIKTDHDFNLEKQNLVHNGKLKLDEEYAQKHKNLDVQLRVARSASIGSSRVKKMKHRDQLLEKLKQDTLAKLEQFSSNPNQYKEFLKQIIIQGLIKIEEDVVQLQVRPNDKEAVNSILADAISTFKSLMTKAGHPERNIRVTISDIPLQKSRGGLILTALNNRIVVNQTVEERLSIAYNDLQPTIRKELFSISA